MFGAQGFARTRTEDVAEQAGYGQATVFFHFKTKLGLLEACLEEALARARASLVPAEGSDTLDLVRRLDRAFDSPQTAAFLSRMLTEFGESSAIRPVYAAFHHHIRLLLAEAIAKDVGVSDARAYEAAALILCAMVGVHAEQRLDTTHISPMGFRDMLLRVTRLVLRDLATAP